jgi:hypothetical protein
LDFGSAGAFDAHRVGKHAYTYSEGIAMVPMREDGRRCLSVAEIREAGWGQDRFGRWRQPSKVPFSARQLGKSAVRVPIVAPGRGEASLSSRPAENEKAA